MCFRKIPLDLIVKGVLLAMVEREFPERVPSLREFARQTSTPVTTFTRAAEAIASALRRLLASRRPGPKPKKATEEKGEEGLQRQAALEQLEDLRAWLRDKRRDTPDNTCFEPEAKQRIATLCEEIRDSGVLKLKEIAEKLGLHDRQLRRIRKEVQEAGNEAPREKSRRPHKTADLHPEIQNLIENIVRSKKPRRAPDQESSRQGAPSRKRAKKTTGYRPIDVKRILQKNYADLLEEHHGRKTIALSTVSKYMERPAPKRPRREHPRGSFTYPEPFQQVAIDTSHFKIGDRTLYIITVFEVSGRLNLITRVFYKEDTGAVVRVIEEYLRRFPGIDVFVIDRGTPYFNQHVKELLQEHGVLRLVCAPESPTMKAAAERHFRTLKTALRKSLRIVTRRQSHSPGLADTAFALEVAAQCFAELYHQIPQEGIDGKSPAERIESFDVDRAAQQAIELFGRVLDLEPTEEVASRIHSLFQLRNSRDETIRELRHFGTPVLRQLIRKVAPFMGPPHPEWMYDPLGYLAAKARGIWEQERREALEKRQRRAKKKRRQEEDARLRQEREHTAKARRTSPERYVDETVKRLIRCVGSNFTGGIRIIRDQLQPLFCDLARHLGHAFEHELRRLKRNVDSSVEDPRTRRAVHAILEESARRARDPS